METLLDSGSPRRGSLSSLHRQSTGSSHYSHNSKLASPGSTNSNHSPPSNNTNFCKDLDKFTRYFIIKTVQVIVQSRISKSNKARMECKPSGNDWFSINISDIPEVRDITKAALDTDGFTVRSNWRVCCEISLKTNDGSSLVLEHWIISNKSIANPASNSLNSSAKLAQNQSSPKSPQHNRNPSPINTPNSNLGNSPSSALSATAQQSPTRVRTATFSNTTTRTRLNSVEDCSSDNFLVNKLLVGANNDNTDFKASKSCYSLSNSQAINQTTEQNQSPNSIAPSPSISSLPTNNSPTLCQSSNINANAASTTSPSTNTNPQLGSKSNSSSSIYTIYNRMSLLLKTLMTTTHVIPAYRLASRTSPSDSCLMCYRVYTCSPSSCQNTKIGKASVEDINYNSNLESPNKRSSISSSNSSFDSINIRDFVAIDELDHFCPILKLGSIKTEINELDVSVCYRTDVRNSCQLLKSPRSIYDRTGDEDCIIAAKQLLAGNEYNRHLQNRTIEDKEEDQCQEALSYLDQPLKPAFAESSPKSGDSHSDQNLELVESAFDGLLKSNYHNDCEKSQYEKSKNGFNNISTAQSEPIQVPRRNLYPELNVEHSVGSTPKSLTDSFVFVELNPPFATEEQNDIATFFHGPSPVFSHGFDSLKDVDELTHQLADLEANASQLDEFVDNICMSDEENKEEY